MITLNALQPRTSACFLRSWVVQLSWSSWLCYSTLDFVDWARRLLALPLLAWYPSHLRCLIINRSHDFVSLGDLVMVGSWQLLPLGCFHEFGRVEDPIGMILLAFLPVVRALL